jgi:ribosomal protein L19
MCCYFILKTESGNSKSNNSNNNNECNSNFEVNSQRVSNEPEASEDDYERQFLIVYSNRKDNQKDYPNIRGQEEEEEIEDEFRVSLSGLHEVDRFLVGEVLDIFYPMRHIVYSFEGLCLSIRKKQMKDPNTTIVVRNILQGVGIELNLSFYSNVIFRVTVKDYKRKFFFFRRSKLFFLRYKLNDFTRVSTDRGLNLK